MNECDERAFRAGARLVVDQPGAAGLQLLERSADVVDAQRDVVQARPALLDIPRNRGFRRGGFEQLQLRLAHRYEMRPHALRRDLLRRLDLEAERVAVERERRREVL